MPPKASRNGHDDSKSETPNSKEKNGHAASNSVSNGKMRRVASSAGSNLREVTNAPIVTLSAAVAEVSVQEHINPGIQWPAFDREVLHAYRRVYRLSTPTSFTREYHHWVLTQRGSVGLHSPTIARKKDFQRQSKDQLATAVRKHFNGQGVQENDIIVDFLHKARTPSISRVGKAHKAQKTEIIPGERSINL